MVDVPDLRTCDKLNAESGSAALWPGKRDDWACDCVRGADTDGDDDDDDVVDDDEEEGVMGDTRTLLVAGSTVLWRPTRWRLARVVSSIA